MGYLDSAVNNAAMFACRILVELYPAEFVKLDCDSFRSACSEVFFLSLKLTKRKKKTWIIDRQQFLYKDIFHFVLLCLNCAAVKVRREWAFRKNNVTDGWLILGHSEREWALRKYDVNRMLPQQFELPFQL